MTTTRTHQGIQISEIVKGQLIHRYYIGHSMKEAKQLFARFKKGFEQGYTKQ